MKPGYKTTEFWLSLVAMLVGVLLASGVWVEGDAAYKVLAFAASALAALGYSVSRGLAKKGDSLTEAAANLSKLAAGVKPDADPQ